MGDLRKNILQVNFLTVAEIKAIKEAYISLYPSTEDCGSFY